MTSLVAVPVSADEQVFATEAVHLARWAHRPLEQASTPAPLLEALSRIDLPSNCFCWVAAEAGVARALRNDLLERGVARNWIKASGYWVKGEADASMKSMDD